MDDRPFELSDVLKQFRRADEALTEFVAPLWPGVRLAAAWMEDAARLFHVADVPDLPGFYLCGTDDGTARPLREAEPTEVRKYLDYLSKVSVILLECDLAYPASFSERLQGITAPRPIWFAEGAPLNTVQARYDGVNILYDGVVAAKRSPLEDLLAGNSIFTSGELLDVPTGDAGGSASAVLDALHKHPEQAVMHRLAAVLEPAGAIVAEWHAIDHGVHLRWRREDEEHALDLPTPNAPIVTGICLPGARHFDPAPLTRLLLEHALDAWRAE
jgi:hypothetical protein